MRARDLLIGACIVAGVGGIAAWRLWPSEHAAIAPAPTAPVLVGCAETRILHEVFRRPKWTLRIEDRYPNDLQGAQSAGVFLIREDGSVAWTASKLPTRALELTDYERSLLATIDRLECTVNDRIAESFYQLSVGPAADAKGPFVTVSSPTGGALKTILDAAIARHLEKRSRELATTFSLRADARGGIDIAWSPPRIAPYRLAIDGVGNVTVQAGKHVVHTRRLESEDLVGLADLIPTAGTVSAEDEVVRGTLRLGDKDHAFSIAYSDQRPGLFAVLNSVSAARTVQRSGSGR